MVTVDSYKTHVSAEICPVAGNGGIVPGDPTTEDLAV